MYFEVALLIILIAKEGVFRATVVSPVLNDWVVPKRSRD